MNKALAILVYGLCNFGDKVDEHIDSDTKIVGVMEAD